jgi:ABC-2 type transport system permease protein
MTSTHATLPAAPRRKGSPWTGLGTVFLKELADHLGSARMRILEILVLLTGVGSVYTAIQDIRTVSGDAPYLFLLLFTHARDPMPSFIALLGFLIPIIAIGLGFDSINTEFTRRTMSRLLAQPIYRDALLLGKFLAGLATMSIGLVSLWLLILGLGLLLLGIPPTGEEVARGLMFLIVAIAYAGTWLAVALLFSVIFRSPATSALCALGVWLMFSVLWPIIAPFLAQAIAPQDPVAALFGIPSVAQMQWEQSLSRLSPNTLFAEATLAIMHPATRALGPVFQSQLRGAVIGAPLPLDQSLLLVWPQITGLVAAAIILFAATYVLFQRQEIRA